VFLLLYERFFVGYFFVVVFFFGFDLNLARLSTFLPLLCFIFCVLFLFLGIFFVVLPYICICDEEKTALSK